MRSKTLILGFMLVISLMFLNSPSTAASPSILISEVAYDGIGTEADAEFVELFNPTGSTIDLTGWTISDNFATYILSGSISSNGFFIIADNQAGFESTYGVSADNYDSTLALSNSGDELTLEDSSSTLIDYVAWENYALGWSITANTGDSIHRTSTIDTDDVSDFVVETTNPTTSNYLSGSSGLDYLLVNEVLYDTPGTDSVEEWVEIYNPSSNSVDLSSYTISDGEATFGLSGSIAAGDFVVIAKDTAGFNALYGFNPDISGMTLALSNSGDSVTLADSGSTVDVIGWEGELGSLSASTGEVLARLVDTDTDTDVDWEVTSTATPGVQNNGSPPGPDTEAPNISITSPSNGATVYRNVNIATSSSDNVGVTLVEIYINGGLVATSSSYYWDTTGVSDGIHSISATAYDAAGNSGSDSISVTVDNANAPPPPDVGDVKIMAYNVEASGANTDWKQVVFEENADIVMFVETGLWDDNNNQLLNDYCNELNTYFVGIGEDPYNCVGTENVPYSTSGEAIFSRYPIISTNQIAMLTLDDSSTHDPSHDFLDSVIDIGGEQVHFIAAHLKCCGGEQTNYDKRIAQQEGIINYMDDLGNVPIIYGGDLNSFSPEDGTNNLGDLEYHPMSMMLEDTTFHDVSSSYSTIHTWDDPLTTLYPGQFFPTYGHQSAQYTSRIDFITANQFFDVINYVDATVGDTATANTGSDHYSTDFTYNFGDGSSSDTEAPSQVTNLVASPVSDSEIDLSWDPATDNIGVDSYNIYRDGLLVGSSSTTSFSDNGLSASTTYSYEVSAVDAAGNEGTLSSSASTTTESASSTLDMYVSSITIEKTNIHPKNGKFDVLVQIIIMDSNGDSVVGADVTIDFQVPRGDIIQYVATTNSNGVATFVITPPGHSSTGTFSATVVDVSATNYVYNFNLNIETSDSATLV